MTLLTTSTGPVVPARDVALDGAIVYSCIPESEALQWLRRRKLPLVYVYQEPVDGFPSVNIDDHAGARAAAEHLIRLGHRRIGILSSSIGGPFGLVTDPNYLRRHEDTNHVSHQRMAGWLEALGAERIRPSIAIEQSVNDPRYARTLT